MTYKGSNWTRGELGHVPDENPVIECKDCGESFGWRDYWKERINRPEDPFLCDSCLNERVRRQRREENNQEITRWSS